MNFLTKLFQPRQPLPEIKPAEATPVMDRELRVAKWRNSVAVSNFVEASNKQERDANLARQIVHDVLRRVDNKSVIRSLDIHRKG